MSSNKKLLSGASGYINQSSGTSNVEDVFSTFLYTGTGSDGNQIVNGIDLANEGGMVWIKNRTGSNGGLMDTARGVGKIHYTYSTTAENTEASNKGLASFNDDGFLLNQEFYGSTNSVADFVSWTFRKASNFFDVVTWSGNGTAGRQISHSLGSTPGMIWVKNISVSGNGWYIFHRSSGKGTYFIFTTDAALSSTTTWNNTLPTDAHFTVGSGGAVNGSGSNYVAYIFGHDTSDEGLIYCGDFNLSGDSAASINLGWEPQFILMKDFSNTGNWYVFDTVRGLSRDHRDNIYPNLSDESNITTTGNTTFEGTIYPTATGFEVTSDFGTGIYVFMAIRKGPMATPTTRASVFAVEALSGATGTRNYTTNFPVDMIMNPNTSGGVDNIPVLDRLRGTSETRPEWLSTNNNYGRDHPTSSSYGWGFDKSTGYTSKDVWSNDQYGYAWRRAPSFFDMVVYTGNATNRTINHNLGVAPEMMWLKTSVSLADWAIYHGDETNYMELNTNIASTDDQTYWNDTAPTATVFTVGTADTVNVNNYPVVAYLFATVAGISKVGTFSHTNGSSTDVDCGFSSGSSFVIAKRTDSTGDWYLWDSARGIVSGNDAYFLMNTTDAEVTNTDFIDPLNSGFQIASGFTTGTYFFYAIAA